MNNLQANEKKIFIKMHAKYSSEYRLGRFATKTLVRRFDTINFFV